MELYCTTGIRLAVSLVHSLLLLQLWQQVRLQGLGHLHPRKTAAAEEEEERTHILTSYSPFLIEEQRSTAKLPILSVKAIPSRSVVGLSPFPYRSFKGRRKDATSRLGLSHGL